MAKETITNELRGMKVGQRAEFPAEKLCTLQSISSSLGFRLDRKYQTAKDNERRVVVVTRVR